METIRANTNLNTTVLDKFNNKILPRTVPSKNEIEETYNLLKDFGIFINKKDIPRNLSTFELHLWRRSKIKAYLQN